jgi:3-oxoacyl-[acyl-carrier protein] reductase
MDLGLAGRHVLVAGASRGLGFSIVSQLLAEGVMVTAVGRDQSSLDHAERRWMKQFSQARVETLRLDLSASSAIAPLELALARQGELHGLIVVAGSGRPTGEPLNAAFSSAVARNVTPALVAIEASKPLLRKSENSAIVLISSIAGLEFIQCPPEYAAAKSTIHAYGSHWARELSPTRVNVLAPGNILTEGSVWEGRLREDPEALNEYLAQEVSLRRLAQPDEVARVAIFLVSQASSFMTGSSVVVDGGQVRQW